MKLFKVSILTVAFAAFCLLARTLPGYWPKPTGLARIWRCEGRAEQLFLNADGHYTFLAIYDGREYEEVGTWTGTGTELTLHPDPECPKAPDASNQMLTYRMMETKEGRVMTLGIYGRGEVSLLEEPARLP